MLIILLPCWVHFLTNRLTVWSSDYDTGCGGPICNLSSIKAAVHGVPLPVSCQDDSSLTGAI